MRGRQFQWRLGARSTLSPAIVEDTAADLSRGWERDRRQSPGFDEGILACRIDSRKVASLFAHQVMNHRRNLYWDAYVTTAVDA